MPRFFIEELSDSASIRMGKYVEVQSLDGAKRSASRDQVFKGTVIRISDEKGQALANKGANGRWENR